MCRSGSRRTPRRNGRMRSPPVALYVAGKTSDSLLLWCPSRARSSSMCPSSSHQRTRRLSLLKRRSRRRTRRRPEIQRRTPRRTLSRRRRSSRSTLGTSNRTRTPPPTSTSTANWKTCWLDYALYCELTTSSHIIFYQHIYQFLTFNIRSTLCYTRMQQLFNGIRVEFVSLQYFLSRF